MNYLPNPAKRLSPKERRLVTETIRRILVARDQFDSEYENFIRTASDEELVDTVASFDIAAHDVGENVEYALNVILAKFSEDRRNPGRLEDFEQNPKNSPKIAGKILEWLNRNFTEKLGGDPPYILMSSKKYFGHEMPMGARFVILGDANFEYFLAPGMDMLAAQEQAADWSPKKLQKLGREFSALCERLGYSWDIWSSNVLVFFDI